MGLFNNLMPGESYGIPDPYQSRTQGLLSDPLLNIGLGILANNNSRNLGQVLGRGALSGLQNVQQQQQFEQQRKMQEQQSKRYDRESQKFDAEEAAHDDFDAKFPQYKGLSRLDPRAAIKISNPDFSTSTADPFTSIQYDSEGNAFLLNQRETDPTKALQPITIGGKPFTGAKYSPTLLGGIKQAEAGGTAAYNVDTSIPGVVSTAKQIAEQANPSLVQQPIPQIPQGTPRLPQGAPQAATPQSMRVPAPVQRQRDDKRLQILLAERDPNMPNPELEKEIARMGGGQVSPVGGIRVPTAAELAAEKKAAEDAAEFNSPENLRKREQAYKFKTTTGKAVLDTIDDASKRVNNWTAGLGGSSLRGIPASDAYDLNSDIETIKANFGFDRLQAMRDMSPTGGALGGIAVQELTALQASVANLDTAQSPKQLKKNLDKAKLHYKNWLDTLEETKKSQDGAIMPNGETMPTNNGKKSSIGGGWSAKRK